jgi:hypothetical protein
VIHKWDELRDRRVQLGGLCLAYSSELNGVDLRIVEVGRGQRCPVVGGGEVLLALDGLVEFLDQVLVRGYGVEDTYQAIVCKLVQLLEKLVLRFFVVECFSCTEGLEELVRCVSSHANRNGYAWSEAYLSRTWRAGHHHFIAQGFEQLQCKLANAARATKHEGPFSSRGW